MKRTCSGRLTGISRGPVRLWGYTLGQRKMLELRQRAQKELGSRFDIRSFHDLIIDSGALPLDMLDARVRNWVRDQPG